MSDSLTILYQDDWLVAVNKPAGHLVHPAEEPQPDNQVTMKILRDQIGRRVHVIHRLDRPTCGVLIFATEEAAARQLHQAFERRKVEKVYWAVTDGCAEEAQWTCEQPLRKNEGSPERSATTYFRVIEQLPNPLTLIEARPMTGRFHQIRRHLAHAGMPIVGDYRYADIARCDALGRQLGTGSRMLLQAKRLTFDHPCTGESLVIEADTDSALQQALDSSA